MSGIKRKIEGNDPDYEDISLAQNNKRSKADEHNGKQLLHSSGRHLLLNIYTRFFRFYTVDVPVARCRPLSAL